MFPSQSKCAHCQSTRFEHSNEEPEGSNFKVSFIRCSGCKNPIGVMPYFETNSKIDKLHENMKSMFSDVVMGLEEIDRKIRILSQNR